MKKYAQYLILVWLCMLFIGFVVPVAYGMHTNICNRKIPTYHEPVPAPMKKIVDAHQQELTGIHKVAEFTWLPGWLIKRRFNKKYNRMKGAKVFAHAIKALGSTMLILPKKYTYKLGKQTYHIVEKMHACKELMTIDEIKEIIRLAKYIRWRDAHGKNFMKIDREHIAIIDTEDRFASLFTSKKAVKKKIIQEMVRFVAAFNQKTQEYLHRKLIQYR